MDPGRPAKAPGEKRQPRVSGDGPSGDYLRYADLKAAPRERGWTHDLKRVKDHNRGSPA